MPALEMGLLKASATFQDPFVHVAPWDHEMPTLTIEEGGVAIELEFPDVTALRRFQRRIADLRLPAEAPRG